MVDKKNKEIVPGIYKHYKGGSYKVLFTAKDTESEEEMVVYYHVGQEDKIWARPKKIFEEFVTIEDKKIPRFVLLEKCHDDINGKYKRALADYQNLLKRTAQEKEEFAKYANEQLLYEMIPVYDNLKMAINHSNGENNDSWLDGVKYVVKQFQDVLSGLGVEEVKTVGEKFDHNTMEAVENEETDNKKNDGLVAKELKAGYWLKGKVIIPAKVVVYKFEK